MLGDLSNDQPSVIARTPSSAYFADGELGPVLHLDRQPETRLPERRRGRRRRAGQPPADRAAQRGGGSPRSRARWARRSRPWPVDSTGRRKPKNPFARIRDQTTDSLVRSQSDPIYVGTKAKGADRNHITKIDLVFKTSPFATASLQTLDQARRVVADAAKPTGPLAGASRVGLTGTTTLVNDLKYVTGQDERRMYLLVTGAST